MRVPDSTKKGEKTSKHGKTWAPADSVSRKG